MSDINVIEEPFDIDDLMILIETHMEYLFLPVKKKAMVSDFQRLEGGDEFDALEMCFYNDWLLRYAFKDILEVEQNEN